MMIHINMFKPSGMRSVFMGLLLGMMLISGLIISNHAWAGTPPSSSQASSTRVPNPDMVIDCQFGTHPFTLRFHSESRDVTNDDMQLFLTTIEGKVVNLHVPPAWYHADVMTSFQVTSLCKGFVATRVSNQNSQVLLWIAGDNRPQFDQLSLVLIDVLTGQVLDKKMTIADIKSMEEGDTHLTLRKNGQGIDVRLVREVMGKTNDDTAYNYIEDWMHVIVEHHRIENAWLRP